MNRYVAALVDDLLGNRLLTTHGVNGNEGTADIEQIEKGGNGRDFVGFVGHRHLAERQALFGGPGADYVQGAEFNGARTAKRLPIDRDMLDMAHRNKCATFDLDTQLTNIVPLCA
jgi:hypothetical protein